MNERLYSGVREPSYSAFATDSAYYNPDAGTPKYDLEKAKALVEDLGGLKFSIACIPTPEADGILQLVKQMGEQAGMKITLETQEQGAYVNRIFAKGGDYEAACFRTTHFIEPDAWRPGLTTDDTANLIFYSNPKVDKLLDEARQTADVDERQARYFEAQEITGEEVPAPDHAVRPVRQRVRRRQGRSAARRRGQLARSHQAGPAVRGEVARRCRGSPCRC